MKILKRTIATIFHPKSMALHFIFKSTLFIALVPIFSVTAQTNDQIEKQCDQEYDRIVNEATDAQKSAVAKSDFSEIIRLNLVRSIKIRNLYSNQCAEAKRASSRRELGQRGIDMNKNFCAQWGMGDQCAAPPVINRKSAIANTAETNQSNQSPLSGNPKSTHDPAAEAHECIAIDNGGSGNFGAFKNTCGYKVNFTTCNYRARTTQGGFNWSNDFDCEKQQFGLHTPSGGTSVAAHNRNAENVYWYACKAPAMPGAAEFIAGKGISARCR